MKIMYSEREVSAFNTFWIGREKTTLRWCNVTSHVITAICPSSPLLPESLLRGSPAWAAHPRRQEVARCSRRRSRPGSRRRGQAVPPAACRGCPRQSWTCKRSGPRRQVGWLFSQGARRFQHLWVWGWGFSLRFTASNDWDGAYPPKVPKREWKIEWNQSFFKYLVCIYEEAYVTFHNDLCLSLCSWES